MCSSSAPSSTGGRSHSIVLYLGITGSVIVSFKFGTDNSTVVPVVLGRATMLKVLVPADYGVRRSSEGKWM